MLDVPDFEDPVRVERVDAATPLVTHHVDNVIVLQGRPRSQVDRLQSPGCSHVVLAELVAAVEEHDLAQGVHRLE